MRACVWALGLLSRYLAVESDSRSLSVAAGTDTSLLPEVSIYSTSSLPNARTRK